MATTAPLVRSHRRNRVFPRPSLRALATLAVPSVAILIVILATWLLASARIMDSAVHELVADGQRARYLEQVESSILRYQRLSNAAVVSGEPGPHESREAELVAMDVLLHKADRISETHGERSDVQVLRARIDAYVHTRRQLEARQDTLTDIMSGTRAPLNGVLAHLDEMQRRYQQSLRESERRTATVARRANLQGAAVIVLVMLTAVLTVVLFRRQVVVPLDRLRAAILEFRASGRGTQADESGPLEIREIARTLNETTSALAGDRKRQLAFVAGVAHDLKSPLTALSLAVSLLEELVHEPDNAAARARALRQIAGNADRLRRMVEDLMDVTRSEAGELALTVCDFDLRAPVRAVVELHFQHTVQHRIALETPDTPVVVRGDAARIEQAVVNLISNAIKYSPQGGVVRVAIARTDAEAVISVSDEGVGIPEDEVAVIFEPFHRGTVSQHVAPGAGLGLSILARIVRAHGGRMEVESTLGHGSTFRMILPLAQRDDRAASPS